MRIVYSWLKEYVDVKLPPERLAELLTMSGLSVESVEKFGSDHILEIEVTSNRPDCLSVIGIAREVAAITDAKLKIPIAKVPKLPAPSSQLPALSIKVEDKKLCPRYTGRVIRGVKVGDSPAWLRSRIEAMELRPVNNIVDITNFCLFETGEPMHAFDMDKVSGGKIVIRKAKKAEKIVTIDGIERTLDESVLVIADKDRAIAIAGVMGGLNAEVTHSTKNILLEAAYFDPVSIRRTARSLGISTESSYRFERRVDVENIPYSSDRAAGLIAAVANGSTGEMLDMGEAAKKAQCISLGYSGVNKVLGLKIPPAKVKKILNSLGLDTKFSGKEKIKSRIPGFRYDLQDEIDLIEEIARIYGYGRIPSTIPDIVEQPVRRTADSIITEKIREMLTGLGLDEIVTYSLLGKTMLDAAGLSDKGHVEIANPLSAEQAVMRPSLVPGMLNAIAWNINRKMKDLRFFEIGNIYIKGSDGTFSERNNICIGMTGRMPSGWLDGGENRLCNFFDLKGVLEILLSEFGVCDLSLRNAKDQRFSPSTCASVEINNEPLGILGEISAKALKNFDIKDKVYAAEIDAEMLLRHSSLEKQFRGLPKYPSAFRDISIIVGRGALNKELEAAMKNAAGPVLKDIKLIDRYTGKQIPEGKVSLTYRLEYRDPQKTLEDKDVAGAHSNILRVLEDRFGAKLR